ncbi:MAG: EamA family transporter [Evtepia gabavorous]
MSDQSTPVTRLPLRKGASLRWLPFLFIFLQSVLYGLGDPISKSAYEVLPVYSLLTARYGIALAFLLLVFGRRIWRGLKVCSPRDWLLPSLCMGGAYVANNIALELTAATSVAFLRSLSTMMTPLLALAFYRRKFGKNTFRFSCWSLWGSTCSAAWAGCPGLVWEKSFPSSPPFCWPGP